MRSTASISAFVMWNTPPAVPSAAVPMPKRDEAETTEEIITDEIRERLARIEERQISMGNHSDDQHELREAD